MENAQPPKLFRKNDNKVALSEVEEKLKVMRQKRLSRLSTFIDEQNKLLEERSTKSDAMEEAILSIQQSAPEKVKFSIKPIAEDRSEDSAQEEGTNLGEKKKTVRTKKLFERFSCVGQGFDDCDEEEDEESFRRDEKPHGIVSGTLTLHRKSKEFKKENQTTSRVADQDFTRVAEKSENIVNKSDGKFTYGRWTPQKLPKEIDKVEPKPEEKRSDESSQLSSKDNVNLEKNKVLNKIAYGNLLPKKTPNETNEKSTSKKEYENVKLHHSPAEKSNSFTTSDRITKNSSTFDSKSSKSPENVNPSYVTLTFPRKPKPTMKQDAKVQEDQDFKLSEMVNKTTKKEEKDPPSKLNNRVADQIGDTLEENVYENVAVKDNKMVLNTDKIQERLDLDTKVDKNTSSPIQKDTIIGNIEETECLRNNETDEIKLALKKQSETDINEYIKSNPKSPIPTPRKVGAEYNTVLDFQTNMLHLTRRGDMDEEDIEEFNACYKKMARLLEDYRRRMLEVERRKLPRRRLSQIKEALSAVDQRIKRYRGLKRDAEYSEMKNLLSGFFSEISRLNVDVFEKKEEKDELLKLVDRCAKKLAKKAVKNEEAMTEVFRDQIDLITAKRVVGTYI
ncbi:unnamed protein product [Callosobruchus maculatus]|uniref:Uncharacterized protein n=1 Tax=Callosobruchus maculatus TaxID=64391 RepID=A0A653CH76_CALMS|nr:unnamed protein product [Callosobruchus maculatus]